MEILTFFASFFSLFLLLFFVDDLLIDSCLFGLFLRTLELDLFNLYLYYK